MADLLTISNALQNVEALKKPDANDNTQTQITLVEKISELFEAYLREEQQDLEPYDLNSLVLGFKNQAKRVLDSYDYDYYINQAVELNEEINDLNEKAKDAQVQTEEEIDELNKEKNEQIDEIQNKLDEAEIDLSVEKETNKEIKEGNESLKSINSDLNSIINNAEKQNDHAFDDMREQLLISKNEVQEYQKINNKLNNELRELKDFTLASIEAKLDSSKNNAETLNEPVSEHEPTEPEQKNSIEARIDELERLVSKLTEPTEPEPTEPEPTEPEQKKTRAKRGTAPKKLPALKSLNSVGKLKTLLINITKTYSFFDGTAIRLAPELNALLISTKAEPNRENTLIRIGLAQDETNEIQSFLGLAWNNATKIIEVLTKQSGRAKLNEIDKLNMEPLANDDKADSLALQSGTNIVTNNARLIEIANLAYTQHGKKISTFFMGSYEGKLGYSNGHTALLEDSDIEQSMAWGIDEKELLTLGFLNKTFKGSTLTVQSSEQNECLYLHLVVSCAIADHDEYREQGRQIHIITEQDSTYNTETGERSMVMSVVNRTKMIANFISVKFQEPLNLDELKESCKLAKKDKKETVLQYQFLDTINDTDYKVDIDLKIDYVNKALDYMKDETNVLFFQEKGEPRGVRVLTSNTKSFVIMPRVTFNKIDKNV